RALHHTQTVELRLDWLADDREIERFLRQFKAARYPRAVFLATCRRRQAGGRFRGAIGRPLLYLAQAIRAGCHWYDLEIESASKCPRELLDVLLGEGRRMTSAHFFRGTPGDLARVSRKLSAARPDAIKLAAQCNTLADGLNLLSLARRR